MVLTYASTQQKNANPAAFPITGTYERLIETMREVKTMTARYADVARDVKRPL